MLEEIVDFLSLEDQGDTLLQQVTFLNHPDCCHQCKRPGHLLKDCTNLPHFRTDTRIRLNSSQASVAPADSLGEDLPPEVSAPLDVPLPSGAVLLEHDSIQVRSAPNSVHPVGLPRDVDVASIPIMDVPESNSSFLTAPELLGLNTEQAGDLDCLPTSPLLPVLRIRTTRTVGPILEPSGLDNSFIPEIQNPVTTAPSNSRPQLSLNPVSPGHSSQGNSAGSKRWADYSSDSDGGDPAARHSLGGGRLVLSPHLVTSTVHQRERSPDSSHLDAPRFSIKAAAHHTRRPGRGASRKGKH
ncbi:unnamed protein product [Calypogeia fissa]